MKCRTGHGIGLLTLVGGVLFLVAGIANATLYTWNTTGSVNPGSGAACAGGVACKLTFTSTSGALTLTAQAYSTDNTTTGSANWDEARIATGSGGIGISNLHDTNEVATTVPYHAIDNNGVKDVLVFELPTGYAWNANALTIGWEYTTANGKPTGFSADSDLDVFIGNKSSTATGAGFDFRNACFSGTGCDTSVAGKGKTLASLGFTEVTAGIPAVSGGTQSPDGASAAGGLNMPANVSIPLNTVNTGRYLVVAGDLSSTNDYVKISQLVANAAVRLPIPGTLALFGLGLLLLVPFRGRIRNRV